MSFDHVNVGILRVRYRRYLWEHTLWRYFSQKATTGLVMFSVITITFACGRRKRIDFKRRPNSSDCPITSNPTRNSERQISNICTVNNKQFFRHMLVFVPYQGMVNKVFGRHALCGWVGRNNWVNSFSRYLWCDKARSWLNVGEDVLVENLSKNAGNLDDTWLIGFLWGIRSWWFLSVDVLKRGRKLISLWRSYTLPVLRRFLSLDIESPQNFYQWEVVSDEEFLLEWDEIQGINQKTILFVFKGKLAISMIWFSSVSKVEIDERQQERENRIFVFNDIFDTNNR